MKVVVDHPSCCFFGWFTFQAAPARRPFWFWETPLLFPKRKVPILQETRGARGVAKSEEHWGPTGGLGADCHLPLWGGLRLWGNLGAPWLELILHTGTADTAKPVALIAIGAFLCLFNLG